MPKKTKTPTPPRSSIPMSARTQEDEEFRPVAVSLEWKTLAVESIDLDGRRGGVVGAGAVVQDTLLRDVIGWTGVGNLREHKDGELVQGRYQLQRDWLNGSDFTSQTGDSLVTHSL